MFKAHVEEEFEAAHSNGPVGHRCRTMHGHTWKVEVEYQYGTEALNEYGWGPDFGAVKAILKSFDHQNLNELLTFPPSAENIARHIWNQVVETVPRVARLVVIVHEGGGNSVQYGGLA